DYYCAATFGSGTNWQWIF
nr:immunoglobulin light chain junction region [Macaca mulatta]MOX11562.1 immunoglobulin light chain junction region [Macaca mulatta]MOX13259.1 immunoglobulin light chain junction region [Macaca mulatta]MOX13313.1 immunoglobulin light chain junction region [Macaca mulatta]MOX13730.1 immunoglobulin light chain junction region [Macaca mulatta]